MLYERWRQIAREHATEVAVRDITINESITFKELASAADRATAPDESLPADPREHWAYRPPALPTMPAPKKWEWIGQPLDMLIAALHNGTNKIPNIISYLDYLNHVVYTEKEIEEALNKLRGEGIAKEENGLWLYDLSYSKNDSSFIF